MFLLLFAVWLILNGKITTEIIIIGLLLSALIYLFTCKTCGISPKKELRALTLTPLAFLLVATLFWEIIKASCNVLKIVLAPSKRAKPCVTVFKPLLKTDLANAVLASSITLTPGTITVSVEKGSFTVHCLRDEYADTLDNWIILKILRRMEALHEA